MIEPYYDDGQCVIYHGSAEEAMFWVLSEADVLITDPPYGVAHTQGGFNGARRGRSIINDDTTTARDDALAMWGSGPALVFGSPLKPPVQARQVLVWQKGPAAGLIGATWGWRRDWEAIYLCGDWPVAPEQASSVLRVDADRQGAKFHGHPHVKPLALMYELLRRCPAGTVLDSFMGSGTTLVAAKQLGRKAIGIEIEERYCEIAAKRLGQEVLDLGAA